MIWFFYNEKFLDYRKEIYPSHLTVEKASKSDYLANYLDHTFIIGSGGELSTRLYDRRDDFDFQIVNFPFLSSNIRSGLFYGVYILQLIRYARCCSHYDNFSYRHKCLTDRLRSQDNIALRSVKVMVIDSFPDNLYLTCSRNLVTFVICMDLSLGFVYT